MNLRSAFHPHRSLAAIMCAAVVTLVAVARCTDAQVEKASAAHISVLVINPRSGQPLKNVDVMASSWNGKEDENTPVTSYAKTDGEGKASFTVPLPLLRHVSFVTVPPDAFEFCSTLKFATAEVVHAGVLGAYDSTCGKLKWRGGGPTSGEVVIFVRPLNFWQRMIKEIP